MVPEIVQKAIKLVPWRLRSMIRHVPVVAPLQRWVLRRYVNREFVHTIDAGPARGLIFPIRLPEDKGVWTGSYEKAFAEALASAVTPGDIAYDVGAYRGFMSGVLALAGARRVITFEPLPRNIAHLQRLFYLNRQLPLVLLTCAVGESDSEAQFEIMPEASMGKVSGSYFQPDQRGQSTLRVRMRSLDSLVENGEIPAPSVVKIDVEGAELSVLRGARKVLISTRPKLLIEAHTPELLTDSTAFLRDLGYNIMMIDPERAVSINSESRTCHFIAK